jgi:chemotaxis protein histidine kinase CheA
MDALQKQLGNGSPNPDALEKMKDDIQKARDTAKQMADKDGAASEAAKDKMNQALADLAKQAKEKGLSLPSLNEAIASLAKSQVDQVVKDLQVAEIDLEKMESMAKALEKMQLQAEQLGKDLAEQLKNGQAEAAQATLRKMPQDLQASKLSPEQMEKMMKDVANAISPGKEYGKVGDLLKDAAGKMQAGQKAPAGESLAAAAKELDKMMGELGDAQALISALEALQQAQMAIGSGQAFGLSGGKPSWAKGQGAKSKGGVGAWTDENSWVYPEFADRWDNTGVVRPDMDAKGLTDRGDGGLADNLAPTKIKGQMTPGGPMPSITLKGVSIKGTSKVNFKEVAAAAQSDAQSALSQEQVPRAYQGAVRDYFNDLKE